MRVPRYKLPVELVPRFSDAHQSDQCPNPDGRGEGETREWQGVRWEAGISRSSFSQQMWEEHLPCAECWECND